MSLGWQRVQVKGRLFFMVGAFLGSLLLGSFGLARLVHAQGAQQAPPVRTQETLPRSVAPQPVAFSHRVHAGEDGAGLPCNFCHTGVDKEDEAKIPSADFCLTCHRTIKANSPEIAKVRAAAEKGKKIAWVPVYRVPDFVFFGHAQHVKAGLNCGECHGSVEKRDVLQQEVSTGMNFCRDCHLHRGARADCAACHQLGY